MVKRDFVLGEVYVWDFEGIVVFGMFLIVYVVWFEMDVMFKCEVIVVCCNGCWEEWCDRFVVGLFEVILF